MKSTLEKTKHSKFQGKPYDFLGRTFGKTFLEEYLGRIKSDYNYAPALDVLSYGQGFVKGSNPFAVVLVNKILGEEGLRTATQVDLEKVLNIKALDLSRIYVDTGLVLRGRRDEHALNNPLAGYLAKQVKERGIMFNQKNPVMISLMSLELENVDNNYGLVFKLKEDAEIYEASVLNKEGKFISEDIDKKTGLPKETGEVGNRSLYIRDSGLSTFSLCFGSALSSNQHVLNISSTIGRIVIVDDGKK